MKSLRIAMLATVLLASVSPRALAGTVTVEIFGGFDFTNAPTGMPLTDYKGSFVVPHTDFYYYDFGHPFGLSTFAARISFTMYMSHSGYYIGGLDSNASDGVNWSAAPVYWTEGYPFSPYFGGIWAGGLYFGESFYEAGLNHFEIVYLGLPEPVSNGPGAGMLGGGPHRLGIGFFSPWGGDPRVDHGAFSFVVVPDSIGTLGGTLVAMLALLALRRQCFRAQPV